MKNTMTLAFRRISLAASIVCAAAAITGCANVPGLGSTDSSAAGGSSQGKKLADASCTAPLGTVNIDENTSQSWYSILTSQYQLPSLIPVIRLLVQQSNCFVVVDRNAALNHSMQERQLANAGLLRSNSNYHGNQIVAADYTIEPSVTFSNSNMGGLVGAVSSFVPLPGVGQVASNLNMKEAEASLIMVDNRSSVQLAAATGSAKGFDIGGFATGTIQGKYASLGAYANTPQGKVVLASFIDAYNQLVASVKQYKQQNVQGGLGTGGGLTVQGGDSGSSAQAGGQAQQGAQMSMIDAQRRLNQLGFNVGTPDGSYGPHTRAAIIAFQRSRELPETGRLDASTEQALSH